MIFESDELDSWHKEMNSEEYIPQKGFRRDVTIYPLVCFVNNIICCYLSKHLKPIPIFIERARTHMQDNPPIEEWEEYYSRVNKYFNALENHLRNNGANFSE